MIKKHHVPILLFTVSLFLIVIINCAKASPNNYVSKIILKVPYGKAEGQAKFMKNGPYIDAPLSFAVDEGSNVFIEDSGNYRILKFDKEGKYVNSFGKKGISDGEFGQFIYKIDADSDGNIYAIDYHNYRVEKFDNNGKFLTAFRSRGADPKTRSHIEDIKIAKSGRIYIYDTKEGTQVFNTSGNFVQGGAARMIEDRSGNVYRRTRGKKEGRYVMGLEKYTQAKGVMTIQSNQAEKTLSISPTDSSYPPQDVIGFDDSGNFYVLMVKERKEGTYETVYFIKKYDSGGNFIQNIELKPLVALNGGGRRFLVAGDGSIYQMNQLMDGIEIIKYSKE